jgi:hypothetical protein
MLFLLQKKHVQTVKRISQLVHLLHNLILHRDVYLVSKRKIELSVKIKEGKNFNT